jgi:GTP-binding protein Era
VSITSAVVIDTFETQGELRRIQATIFVDREGHKAIVIGEKGATLKRIGTEARLGMQDLFGSKVFLELWVKVKSGWADNEAIVREWGHG